MTGSNKVIVAQCEEVMTVQVESHPGVANGLVGPSSKAAHQVYKARIVIQTRQEILVGMAEHRQEGE
jgi:hypothetical protein